MSREKRVMTRGAVSSVAHCGTWGHGLPPGKSRQDAASTESGKTRHQLHGKCRKSFRHLD
jgi:hypothetical protein